MVDVQTGPHGHLPQMSTACLHRYVNESTDRHNICPLDTEAQMAWVVAGMVGKKLYDDDLINAPEPVTAEPF